MFQEGKAKKLEKMLLPAFGENANSEQLLKPAEEDETDCMVLKLEETK